MIFGNTELVHINGAEYIRVACLGQLHEISEQMGMDIKNSRILADALDELHDRLKESMYKEIKNIIPDC